LAARLEALASPASCGAPTRLGRGQRDRAIRLTCDPTEGDGPWSTRRLAQRFGWSQSSASRVQRELALLPIPRVGTAWAATIDLQRVVGIAGVHLDLALRAFALLARPQSAPIVAVADGTSFDTDAPHPLHHELDRLERELHRSRALSQRRQSSLKLRGFLKGLARALPRGHCLHVLAATPEPIGPAVRRWLAKTEGVHLHRAATRSAWRDLLDGWCAALAARADHQPRWDSLAAELRAHLAEGAIEPRPLTWTHLG
ncbi:MAG: hypothetical protein JRI23_35985, partial [Deltaproteobacteria bacterium]|nr:hypothetical protein [Deltaproteobacteria bacterium]MBW2537751.1 hypothetical protein [Deltaproteobacteria bacterium]